jgi:hypothetical protein
MLYRPAWSPKEYPLTTTETPPDFAAAAIHDEHQNHPNLPTVADAIINKRSHAQASRAASARKLSGRRRFVDPTTCERDCTEAEMEFMRAMQLYKQASGPHVPELERGIRGPQGPRI